MAKQTIKTTTRKVYRKSKTTSKNGRKRCRSCGRYM